MNTLYKFICDYDNIDNTYVCVSVCVVCIYLADSHCCTAEPNTTL